MFTKQREKAKDMDMPTVVCYDDGFWLRDLNHRETTSPVMCLIGSSITVVAILNLKQAYVVW